MVIQLLSNEAYESTQAPRSGKRGSDPERRKSGILQCAVHSFGRALSTGVEMDIGLSLVSRLPGPPAVGGSARISSIEIT